MGIACFLTSCDGCGEYKPTLVLATEGAGSGSLSAAPAPGATVFGCEVSADCYEYELDDDLDVTVTATPQQGSRLAAWSGDCSPVSSNPNQATVTLEIEKVYRCTGRFELDAEDLDCDAPGNEIIEDDFESSRSWVTSASTGGTAPAPTESSSWVATGGAGGGGHRRMEHLFTGTVPAPDPQPSIGVYHFFQGETYNPATQGAIAGICYSETRIKFAPTGSAAVGTAWAALRQGGSVYYHIPPGAAAFTDETWTPVGAELRQEDFQPRPGPNFSVTGAPIEFGYLRSNSNRAPTTIVHGIDNWRVTLVR